MLGLPEHELILWNGLNASGTRLIEIVTQGKSMVCYDRRAKNNLRYN
jgi:hypothetical protein